LSIITVRGFLFHRLQSFGPFSFHTYDYIRAQFRSALSDPEVKAIIFDIDSPGGEAAGAFDLADDIYQARGSKPVYAVANETAYSAAYAIASAADKVYIPRTGSVGSIGLIAVHTDQSRFDEKIGLTYTPIFAGSRKNDFTPHEPLSAKARDAGQSMVDDVYDIFVETVARNRNMTIADIRKTEAALYMGEGAVNAGLVDKVMSWNDVLGDVGQKIFGNKSVSLFNKKKEAIGLCENRSKPFREIETARKEIEEEVRAWVTSILETCSIAKMEKMAIDLIKSEVSLEEARKKIVNAKAAEAERTQIRSTVGALSTGAVNPLIENAKKIAAEALKKPQM
jgi:signal peptide peptidase SppA